MRISKIVDLINGRIITQGNQKNDFEFSYAFSSDLMSDVLRINNYNTVLITGLCNIQTIRTVEMAEIKCVIIARGKKSDSMMTELAEENDICIIETAYSVFRVSGILYQNGIKPIY